MKKIPSLHEAIPLNERRKKLDSSYHIQSTGSF